MQKDSEKTLLSKPYGPFVRNNTYSYVGKNILFHHIVIYLEKVF